MALSTASPSGKTPAWWKKIDNVPSPGQAKPPAARIMDLPGELRNMLFETLANDMDHVVIHNGKIVPHPFAQANQQARQEFGWIFNSLPRGQKKLLRPDRVTVQVNDYDFKSAVDALAHCVIGPATKFEIQVRVTKQLFRCEWEKIWPWIEYCDRLMPREEFQGAKIRSNYTVQLELSACNPYAASQELYIEVMPYVCNTEEDDQLNRAMLTVE
ncbi:hypothetical protein HII31_03795 [Pseudocercospora fuligena]|uniref:Uncharacterized protein n=1 Tax=Pseudocercospora fuligena TaxID=685502 RepID=A0A8H6RNY9_9PEZI|nr:hypothetical protein HII31_03795 [Pseudocercospora fuligena]